MISVPVAHRRARLGHRHALARPVATANEAADAVVALHASDPATVFLSAVARMALPSIDAVAAALYDDRTLVRTLAMRRTLFVASREALPAVEGSSSADVARNERRRLEQFLADSDVPNPQQWLDAASAEIDAVLGDRADGATARELTASVPRLATRIVMGAGTPHAVEVGATSRVLGVLAAEGRIVRGRPAGNWTGRQYSWHSRQRWLGEPSRPEHDPAHSAVLLVRAWLRRFGPGTLADLRWWTGWPLRRLRPAIEAAGAVEVELDGAIGYVLPDDLDPPEEPPPWVRLLPALDPTPMGWKDRDWYLGDLGEQLFDRSGNIGPTIWADGCVVGAWGQRPDGEIVTRVLRDVGSDHRALLDATVHELTQAIAGTVVKPSFPTPLQVELSG